MNIKDHETLQARSERLQDGPRVHLAKEELSELNELLFDAGKPAPETESSAEAVEASFDVLAMLLIDATLDGDEACLDQLRRGLQRLDGRLENTGQRRQPVGAERGGRVLSLIDCARWALDRTLPIALMAQLEPRGYAQEFLRIIAEQRGLSNQEIAESIGVDETEVSRVGRRLVESALAHKLKVGRTNRWEITARGMKALRVFPTPSEEDARKLLHTLMLEPPSQALSRKETAQRANLPRAVVDQALPLLRGPLEEVGETSDAESDQSSAVRVNGAYRAVGVSLSRHQLIAVLVDLRREIVQVADPIPLHPRDGEKVKVNDVVRKIAQLVQQLRSASDSGIIIGLGVEVPGPVQNGIVQYSPSLLWENVPLADELGKATGLPTVVENDAHALGIRERWFGQGMRPRSFAVVLVTGSGQGVGSGLVVEDQLLVGSRGAAGEIGHIRIEYEGGRKCNCGEYGHVEAQAGVDAILDYLELPWGDKTIENLRYAADQAADGDERALEAFRCAGRALGRGIAHLIAAWDPEQVIVSAPEELIEDEHKSAEVYLAAMNDAIRAESFKGGGAPRKPIPIRVDDKERARTAACLVLGNLLANPIESTRRMNEAGGLVMAGQP